MIRQTQAPGSELTQIKILSKALRLYKDKNKPCALYSLGTGHECDNQRRLSRLLGRVPSGGMEVTYP